jgi:putative glutathione S-transferase
MSATTHKGFSLGAEGGSEGEFRRQESRFRGTITHAEPGRYHLYVSWACPWAHRAIIGRRLKQLENVITMSAVDPWRDELGWRFTPDAYDDPVNGFRFLAEAYSATDPQFVGRYSVPVLWDREQRRIVNNESGDILRMLNDLSDRGPDLYPVALRDQIDEIEALIYDTVNNGVYKAGFSSRQQVYEREAKALFETLDLLEDRLAAQRYLVDSEEPTEADWRLFTTLVRFDSVYYVHFKCNLRRLVDYPNLWAYTRDLYQSHGIGDTVRLDQIKRHYYTTHPMINPSGLIPIGPAIDFDEPHGRDRMRLREAA